MSVLWKKKNISKDKLQADCDLIANELERLEGWPYPEFSDKTKFQNSQKAYLLKNKDIQRDRYKITQPSGPKSDPSPVVQKFEFEGNPSVTL